MLAVAVAVLFVVPAALVAGYYLAFTFLGWKRRTRIETRSEFAHSFVVLIPAHDEEVHLPDALASIPKSPRVAVVVVADNCTDATARIAREAGASCVVRSNPSLLGKGYALAHGLPVALAGKPDAVLILDADCVLAPGTLAAFDTALGLSCAAVQAPLIVTVVGGESAYVAAVGAEIDRALHRGSARLGLSVPLRGTGMLFRREVLEAHPWSMHGLAEDAEFATVLRRAGVRVHLLDGGAIRAAAPSRPADLMQQRRRWRAALRVPGLGWVERIVASKPLILAHLAATVVTVGTLGGPAWMTWTMAGSVAATVCVYVRAVFAVGGRPGWGSAWLVARLAAVTLAGFWTREGQWKRTARG